MELCTLLGADQASYLRDLLKSNLVRLDGMDELRPELVDGQLLAVLEDGRVGDVGRPCAGVLLARDWVHPVPGSLAHWVRRRGTWKGSCWAGWE